MLSVTTSAQANIFEINQSTILSQAEVIIYQMKDPIEVRFVIGEVLKEAI